MKYDTVKHITESPNNSPDHWKTQHIMYGSMYVYRYIITYTYVCISSLVHI